jgi:hypothetical protein
MGGEKCSRGKSGHKAGVQAREEDAEGKDFRPLLDHTD